MQSPLSYWQAKNWNPAVGSDKFDEFCEALSQPVLVHEGVLGFKFNETMFYDEAAKAVSLPGGVKLDLALLNYAKYIKEVCQPVTVRRWFVANSVSRTSCRGVLQRLERP